MNAILKPSLYEQLTGLPEHVTGEILNGELHEMPRPSGRHGVVERGLGFNLSGPFDFGRGGPGGWWIIIEPEVHFIRDMEVAVPDLAGWRRERMPNVPDDHRFEVVPDWMCEILSPSTAKKDRVVKLPIYARYGVQHVWIVDPLAQTLEAFELQQGRWTLIATLKDDDPVAVPPFDAVVFSLADLWG
ncbi:MAG: Uma2 family endonuclease [Methylovulum sp.]|uniref:Uma2 family endonuclease n=1 Tax=Methylovulum sp. TaxID=1916980 RepID=UPI0026245D18|nr:Uma2 family endonuclease [Methylovulum sp.]MDD2722940.1 Uma2 family endonuclease [Methylovulum sp.]MDD5123253.1 Uma2 family endonuclease [Methylovulum sp.]